MGIRFCSCPRVQKVKAPIFGAPPQRDDKTPHGWGCNNRMASERGPNNPSLCELSLILTHSLQGLQLPRGSASGRHKGPGQCRGRWQPETKGGSWLSVER